MACFRHDMAYGYFKDLPRRTASGKVFQVKTMNASNPQYGGYQYGLVSMVHKFFDKMAGQRETGNL